MGIAGQTKEITNKIVFEKLRKDFADYFDKDLFYSSISSAANES